MRVISHRGNTSGPNSAYYGENHPCAISNALSKGFDVEIDVRYIDGQFLLGHDEPKWKIDKSFFYNDRLFIHCKNADAACELRDVALPDYFAHDTDQFVLTRKGCLWTFPRSDIALTSNSIAVMPERVPEWDLTNVAGVCTDYPWNYR